MKAINVLSLFDGIACARLALERSGIPVEKYFASEVDLNAIKIATEHFPDIVRIGDVRKLTDLGTLDLKMGIAPKIDLLIGGSPCQDLSIAKRERRGLRGERSGLFYEYLRLWNEIQPEYFLLENVASMSQAHRDEISNALSTDPVMIDAAMFSAQNRKRLFWTNIPIGLITDKGLTIADVVKGFPREEVAVNRKLIKTKYGVRWDTSGKGYFSQNDRAYSVHGKMPTIPTARTITKVKFLDADGKIKNLNFEDLEEMQGLPRGYTAQIKSKEKRGGVIGNAFNVDVVAHILKGIRKQEERKERFVGAEKQFRTQKVKIVKGNEPDDSLP